MLNSARRTSVSDHRRGSETVVAIRTLDSAVLEFAVSRRAIANARHRGQKRGAVTEMVDDLHGCAPQSDAPMPTIVAIAPWARLWRTDRGKPNSLQTSRFCITLVADQGAERGKPSWRQPQRISPGELFRRGGKEAP